jgi:hypothetical protein
MKPVDPPPARQARMIHHEPLYYLNDLLRCLEKRLERLAVLAEAWVFGVFVKGATEEWPIE